MALLPCRECAAQVSTEAKVCPHCGIGHPTKKKWKFPRKTVGLVLLGLIALSAIGQKNKPPTNEASNKEAKVVESPAAPKPKAKPPSPAPAKPAAKTPPGPRLAKDGYVGCKTREGLSQLGLAAGKDKQLFLSTMLAGGCEPVGGKEFSVLERGLAVTKIRMYINGPANFVDLWVPFEAVR